MLGLVQQEGRLMWHGSRFGFGIACRTLLVLGVFAVGGGATVAEAAVPRATPLCFERNDGQAAPTVRFVARSSGGSLFLLPGESVLALRGSAAKQNILRMRWLGARTDASIDGEAPLVGRVNQLHGSDRARWRIGIPTFARVRYANLYPGIDAVYYGSGGNVEHDLVVAPGADPAQARIEFVGADSVAQGAAGDLVILLAEDTVRLHAPVAYQQQGAQRIAVASRWVLEGRRARIALGDYERRRPLVIDPVLSYATFFGGNAEDNGGGIAVDATGIVIAGNAVSTDLPTPGGIQSGNAGSADAFLAKLDPTGATLLYATYFGGGGEDLQRGLAVDAQGDLYLFGETTSTDLPTTVGALDRSCGSDGLCDGGTPDTFIAKFDGDSGALVFGTYLGGSGSDIAGKIAVDAEFHPYVAGYTNSADLPATPGAYDTTCGTDGTCNNVDGKKRDCFAAKLDPSGGSLSYLTYLGGSAFDRCFGIDIDGDGRAVVTGSTFSSNFPATPGAHDTSCGSDGSCNGGDDGFVAMLDAAGANLVFATFLGGSGDGDAEVDEYGWAVDADATGAAWVVGQTDSADFPTPNGARTSSGGGLDAFVAHLDATGTTLSYATYLGGAGTEQGFGLVVDPAGTVHVAGVTDSTDFPLVDALPGPGNSCANCASLFTEAFVATLDGGDGSLAFSSYLGGSSSDYGAAVALADATSVYVLGDTYSNDFPTRAPYQATHGSGDNYDMFVVRIAEPGSSPLALAAALALASLVRRRR
jgi:hypothetical protein